MKSQTDFEKGLKVTKFSIQAETKFYLTWFERFSYKASSTDVHQVVEVWKYLRGAIIVLELQGLKVPLKIISLGSELAGGWNIYHV
jgi:hypothetical protein